MIDNSFAPSNGKKDLREKILSEIAGMDAQYIKKSDKLIFENLLALSEYISAESVFTFVGTGWEPDTSVIINDALANGKAVAVPLCTGRGIMEARLIRSYGELKAGKFGIPEPPPGSELIESDRIDLIIAAALCYDIEGYRLGRGGGYYDRYLAGCGAFRVGLCRSRLLLPHVPHVAHDERVSALITEVGCIRIAAQA